MNIDGGQMGQIPVTFSAYDGTTSDWLSSTEVLLSAIEGTGQYFDLYKVNVSSGAKENLTNTSNASEGGGSTNN